MTSYVNSCCRVRLDAVTEIEVRVGTHAALLEQHLPQVRRFGIISAWNPASRRLGDAANALAQATLALMIERAGFTSLPVRNAPDTAWEEAALLLLDPPPDAVDALARRFGQAATLYWRRGDAVRLRAYLDGALGPAYAECMDTPFVDWVACAPR